MKELKQTIYAFGSRSSTLKLNPFSTASIVSKEAKHVEQSATTTSEIDNISGDVEKEKEF